MTATSGLGSTFGSGAELIIGGAGVTGSEETSAVLCLGLGAIFSILADLPVNCRRMLGSTK